MSELNIGLVLPDVLGTYGDDGNALVLRQRARMRGLTAEIHRITLGTKVPENLDVYTVGGGEDVAQLLAAEHLISDGGLNRAAEAGRPVLAICAGLQVLGESFRAAGKIVDGLGLLDATTGSLKKRMIGEITSKPLLPGLTETLTGFANHMGSTILGSDAQPLGKLTRGTGNTDDDAQASCEGALQASVVATYMHGPALARNPQLADYLLAKAMGVTVEELPPLEGSLANQLNKEVTQLRSERLR
ncbi:type 1 glutamine amidotransferase [Corynebacterium anserum]|uniref:Lipid II isoglutaminyl synthase (glutamine-hydrolyzing) subunit GatD n=1 Tax=Corynebacterium anserum TaxID=2684406 RepID=A0A7G7YQH2_9CORY|nr:glutamine amidotransferase [Corynebacterium anserum]QNH96742.1 glutamine amidotransferase [Corynebacterium anserum]